MRGLQKLISYGHLVGEAGLGGGKNGVMATELFNMVCASSDDEATATDRYASNLNVTPCE